MTAVLEVSGVTRRFGAFRALEDVSLTVEEGETLGLIGPNGAGKTTLFNVVTGFLPADAGTVRLAGKALDGLSPARRATRGLVRTFQKALVFPGLTVRENLALAVRRHAGTGLRWAGARRAREAADAEADRLIAGSGLARGGDARVEALSHGERRMVDVLAALALRPRALLLDEPTAGLARGEADRLLDAARAQAPRAAIILVAHDMDAVFARCDRVAVLVLGRLVALGAPAAVRADPAVRAAYLGALAEG